MTQVACLQHSSDRSAVKGRKEFYQRKERHRGSGNMYLIASRLSHHGLERMSGFLAESTSTMRLHSFGLQLTGSPTIRIAWAANQQPAAATVPLQS